MATSSTTDDTTPDTKPSPTPKTAAAPAEEGKLIVLLGLAASFEVATEDGTTYKVTRDGTPVRAQHVREIQQSAVAHRVKIRTLQLRDGDLEALKTEDDAKS
jgi:hypothetical protein